VLVGSLNDYQKERQFQALNAKKDERAVKVLRAGAERLINVHDVVVGDVALLEPGEIVPCDGIVLSSHNVRCDESGATGESDAIKKVPYADALRLRDAARARGARDTDLPPGHTDCFVVSGSRVLEGVGSYVVVAVGPRSFNGRIMMALRGDPEDTPLQLKLNALADAIAWAGMVAGGVLFLGLMVRFFVELGRGDARTASQKGIAFVNILIIAVTLVVVAVPEGACLLPVAAHRVFG
jgi:Ca2+-transporting ATPase